MGNGGRTATTGTGRGRGVRGPQESAADREARAYDRARNPSQRGGVRFAGTGRPPTARIRAGMR